jgi:hypothetical protein
VRFRFAQICSSFPPARLFQHPLISFAFASPSSKSSTAIELVGLARDTSSAGSGSQRLEIVSVPDTPIADFQERSLLIADRLSSAHSYPIPTAEAREAEDAADVRDVVGGGKAAGQTGPSPRTPALHLALSPPDRGRTLSLGGLSSPGVDRNQTPRPTTVLLRQDSAANLLQGGGGGGGGGGGPSSLDESGLYNLSTDISVVLRERVEAGYGSDPMVNANLSDAGVREFWLWVARVSPPGPFQARCSQHSHASPSFPYCRWSSLVERSLYSRIVSPCLLAVKNAGPREQAARCICTDFRR